MAWGASSGNSGVRMCRVTGKDPSAEQTDRRGPSRLGTFVQAVTYRSIVLFALAAGLLLLGLLGGDLLRARSQALAEGGRQARTAAAVVADHTALAISAADNLLLYIRQGLAAGLAAETMVAAAGYSHPSLHTVAVIGAGGRVVASTWPDGVGTDVTGEGYFQAQSGVQTQRDPVAGTADRLWIGPPLMDAETAQGILPLSRRLEGADGAFGGVVMAGVDRGYLGMFVATQALGLQGAVGLHEASGVLIAGQSVPPSLTPDERAEPLIVATQRVGDLPLVVRVAISRDVALEDWTARVRLYGFIAVGLVVLVAGLSVLLMLYARRAREALEATVARTVAERANRAKTDFVTDMSHELRTPVAAMDVIARDLEGTSLDEGQRSQVATLRAAAGYLLSLVGSVLDMARVEAGRFDLQDRDFSPDRLLDQIERLMMPSAAAKGLRLTVERHALPSRAGGDGVRLQQVLLNLVGNAIKYTRRGAVTVVASRDETDGVVWLVFTVSDTGPGLPPSLREDTFRRFAEGTAARDDSSGMGLSVARRICDALGGSLDVAESTARGTTFRFAVPIEDRPERRAVERGPEDDLPAPDRPAAWPEARPQIRSRARSAAALLRPRPAEPAPVPLSLLLAEDDPAQSTVFQATLGAWGHAIHHFAHGDMALDAALKGGFDALIVDVHLPGMSGPDLVRRLRAEGLTIPVIGLTASLFSEELARYRAAGFDHLLIKPVVWEDLQDLLADLGEKARRIPSSSHPPASPLP